MQTIRNQFRNRVPILSFERKAIDDEGIPAKNLRDAINIAMGSHGSVELRNREPLHLTGNQTLDLVSGRGLLVIRAAPGFEPVIEFDLNGTKPLLATGSSVVSANVGGDDRGPLSPTKCSPFP